MRYSIIIATLFLFTKSTAQKNTATLSVQAAFPVGDYKTTYPNTSSGMLFSVVHNLENQPPFSVGGEIGVMQVSGSNKNYTGVYSSQYNTFMVASWNHIMTMAALLKLNLVPYNKSFNLFVDVTIGTNLFLTFTSISRNHSWDILTNSPATEFYYSDTKTSLALRVGSGVGIDVPFGHKKNMAFMAKCSYLYGSMAEYYAKPIINGFQITLAPKESETCMLLAETGISFGIFNKKAKLN